MSATRFLLQTLPTALLLSACGTQQGSSTGQTDDLKLSVRSCYLATGIGVVAPKSSRELFVFVDQTTALDTRLRETLRSNVRGLVENGTDLTVATFSARNQERFAKITFRARIEAPLPQEQLYRLPAQRGESLSRCLTEQVDYARELASGAIEAATKEDPAKFSSSEILASLTELSKTVSASTANDRIVIVVSDLFEHSTTTSFYASQNLRAIDAGSELKKVVDQRLVGNFAKARTYILGAGISPPDSPLDALRNQQSLNELRLFWEEWFRQSNADVREYGQPELVNPIRWSVQ